MLILNNSQYHVFFGFACFFEVFLGQVKHFWCAHMTGDLPAQALSWHGYVTGAHQAWYLLILYAGKRYFSVLGCCDCATNVSWTLKCYLFPYCVQLCFPVMLHLIRLTVVHYVLFSFSTEGRHATRIKDQFEIDLIMLLTPFIFICSMDPLLT